MLSVRFQDGFHDGRQTSAPGMHGAGGGSGAGAGGSGPHLAATVGLQAACVFQVTV